MILFASELGVGAGGPRGGPDAVSAVVRAAGDAGFDGIAPGSQWRLPELPGLVAASSSVGLAVPVVSSPLPEGPIAPGRRLPYLAALDDGDERRAGLAAFTATLEAAATLGIRMLAVGLGEISLAVSAPEIVRRFGRDELGEGEAGARLWASAMNERRGRSGLVLDACRYALDRILPLAERRDVSLSVEIAGGPWGLPGPREAWQLLEEYREGPLGVVWDPARMQVLAHLAATPKPEVLSRLLTAARVWRANEAVGIEAGYLPGLGDPDGSLEDEAPPAGIPIVISGRLDSSPAEIAAARQRLADRTAR